MTIAKKIALTGLLAAVGVVLYRFGRILFRVVTEKPAKSHRTKSPHAKV